MYALSFKKKLTYKVDALHADKHESVFYKLIALFVMDFTGQFTQVNLQYICDILKLETQLPKKKCFICFHESPLKMMKNAFHFILKPLFVFKISEFLYEVGT